MLETKDLILDKANFSDWEGMYENVWSHPESAKYMRWNLTTSEDDAKIRIRKTIEFQKNHDTYLVYEKKTRKPVGFAGVEQISPSVCQEVGICLGPDYVHRGLGKQILQCLIQYSREKYGATEFIYSTRDENAASIRLAESQGFTLIGSDPQTDDRDGHSYQMLIYSLKLGQRKSR